VVEIGSSVVADEQAAVLVEPGEGALDHPAVAAEAGAVCGLAAGDHGLDPTLAEFASVGLRVVAAVGDELVGTAAGAADDPPNRRDGVDERDQLGDVVAVAAGEREGERDAALVDDQVMFGAQPSTVNWARARRPAPFFACTWLESTTARVHSI
jgi:hypothetical protein